MPFRPWLQIYAIIGLSLAGSVQAQEQDVKTEQPATDQQIQIIDFPNPFPVVIVESDEVTASREAEKRASRQIEKDSLATQQGMNEVTQRMMWASWASTVLVALGTILLNWTLRLTRSANSAAQEAVEVTRVVGELQTRPYISLSNVGLPDESVMENGTVDMYLTNIGRSPAFIKSIEGKAGMCHFPVDANSFDSHDWVVLGREDIHHPNTTYTSSIQTGAIDKGMISSKAQRLFFGFRVTYEDFFGNTHEDEYVATVNYNRPNGPGFEAARARAKTIKTDAKGKT
ncbi:hypothetical protein [Thalassobium sp. R2A62]|uniref:hypothetical protein n=1 Tax=Thalassobium sp. R2A62 TaxID=633131 RepID=UPI0001B1D773|nr:hypothetical protein [Thalassobium sp. R2A62]EET49346.1 hypothetical protein TR2A62_1769 [Thalassobium sp. R2A62]